MGKYVLGAFVGSVITAVVMKYREWQEDRIDEPWFVRVIDEDK